MFRCSPQPLYIQFMENRIFLALIWLCVALAVSAEAPLPQLTPARWVYTLQRVGTGDELMKKITENDEMISETERRYQDFVSDPAARRAALERDVWIRDRGQMIRDAREEGLEKGREEGLEEGEQRKARHIAERLIENGLDDSLIQKTTGLSAAELNTLRNKPV
ncbi:MAG: hypothetical protein EA428_08780 [Spirochaetaceae bacterium]|nr:MAG: hypothetical protein EA428_08780 [Spirochaetaceae bacterium]